MVTQEYHILSFNTQNNDSHFYFTLFLQYWSSSCYDNHSSHCVYGNHSNSWQSRSQTISFQLIRTQAGGQSRSKSLLVRNTEKVTSIASLPERFGIITNLHIPNIPPFGITRCIILQHFDQTFSVITQ